MKELTKNQLAELAVMLAEDSTFTTIRRVLDLPENYNIKTVCEYYGEKYIKLFNVHKNSIKTTNINKKEIENENEQYKLEKRSQLPEPILNCKRFEKVTIRIHFETNEQMKQFVKESPFKSAEAYSLAVYEFLEKHNTK